MATTIVNYPTGPRPDWATVCAWIDAGSPDLNPDGTYATDHTSTAT